MTQIERICSLSQPGVTYAWDLETVSAIDHKWDPAVDEDLPEQTIKLIYNWQAKEQTVLAIGPKNKGGRTNQRLVKYLVNNLDR